MSENLTDGGLIGMEQAADFLQVPGIDKTQTTEIYRGIRANIRHGMPGMLLKGRVRP